MSLAIAMWVLIPAALFFVFMHHVLLVGVRTKNIQLHSREVVQASGRTRRRAAQHHGGTVRRVALGPAHHMISGRRGAGR